MYEVRLCKTEEKDLLLAFLKDSWDSEHVFLKNEELLDFQHKAFECYNFVVAFHTLKKSFHGVLGVISPEFYVNRKIEKRQDIWLAIWKVNKEVAESNSLGVDMLKFVENEFSPRSISAIGINDKVALLYRLMGFTTASMNQWFLPNRNISEPKLLVGEFPYLQFANPCSEDLIVDCSMGNETEMQQFFSEHKSRRGFYYHVQRYLRHPYYNYFVYAFKAPNSGIYAAAVGREVTAVGAKAFRLTELVFDSTRASQLGSSFNKLMTRNQYEYIDFMEYGYDTESLVDIGFLACHDQRYVPHWFEPFVAAHVKVTIAFKSSFPFIYVKGDSDLDRPNIG